MKVLVTGGAGFIGSHLVNFLIYKKHQVIIIDDLSHGRKELVNKQSMFIKLDIRSNELKKIVKKEKPDVIYHLAAQGNIAKSREDPVSDFDINLLGTLNLVESSKKSKVKKIILASSAAVYANNIRLPIKEDSLTLPCSIYGLSKLNSELILEIYKKQNGILSVSLRFSNVYGENQDSSGESGVVAILTRRIIQNRELVINGDGKQTRDFIYISDVVDACYQIIHTENPGPFNVSTAKETSINDLAETLLKFANIKLPIVYKQQKFPETQRSSLSYNKLKSICTWQPKTSLEQGLKNTYRFFANKK